MKRLKIVAHNGAAIFGGAEKATALLLSGLQQRGHDVVIYARDAEREREFARHDLDARVFSLGGDIMLPNALRFARRLRSHAPDALLLTTFKKIFLAGLAARTARVPLTIARIGLSTDIARSGKYRFALRHLVDRCAVNSHAQRALQLRSLPDLDPARVRTIHTGVPRPERKSEAGAVRRELGIAGGARVIGTLARLDPLKRLDRLLEVVAALPDVHCIIAGDGPLRDGLIERSRGLGVLERVHFTGRRDDVADVLSALDVFVLTSDREGLSNAMLEALSMGVPVVSTNVSGADEALALFENGDAPGAVVPMEVSAIVSAVSRLLADDALRARMGESAVRAWLERFGYERMLDDWEMFLGAA